uniref:Group III truncated hemoglobin n=1 Tax=Roseihalotalea indica TaxID=2867963 RepID=A0AA49GNS4_9BACT|nr:group III truncated hemoglobin [Tunicatimonas sp. TK19036]
MKKQKQIIALDDIKLLVDSYYGKVREDELLAPIFNERIGNKWPKHLEKMYRFWQTVLLGDHTYYGSPFTPHAQLPVNKAHFNRWLELFNETINEHFTGEKAEEARWRAGKMAEMFHYKIEYYRDNPEKPLL